MTDAQTNPKSDEVPTVLKWVALVLSVGAAIALLWFGREDLRALASVSFWILALLIVGQVVFVMSQSERLRYILEDHSRSRIGRLKWTQIFVRGRIFNAMLLQSGNIYRALALKREGVLVEEYASGMAAQSWIGVSVSLLLATIFSASLEHEFDGLSTTFLSALTLVVVAVPLATQSMSKREFFARRESKVVRALIRAVNRVANTGRNRELAIKLLGHTLVNFIAGSIIVIAAFRTTDTSISLVAAAALLALLQIANFIAITPGNIGVQEVGFAGFSGLLGYSGAVGVIASVLVRISGYVALFLLAMVLESVYRLQHRRSLDSRSESQN